MVCKMRTRTCALATTFVLVLGMAITVISAAKVDLTHRVIHEDKHYGPVAPYSHAVHVGSTLYLSGTLGRTPDKKLVEGFEAQTRQALENIKVVLAESGSSFANVVQVTVILSDMSNFGAMNKIYAEYFTGKLAARTTFEGRNPDGGLIQIGLVAVADDVA